MCDATLHRFFVFHFLFPFILVLLSGVHLVFLHITGSRNPLGIRTDTVAVPFHPYYVWKDLVGVMATFWGMLFVTFVVPDLFSEPENFTPANCLVTPAHIKPEWYFLWAYAILRAVPDKAGGVCALFGAILVLATLPFTDKGRDRVGCPWCIIKQGIFWSLVRVFIFLS